MKSTFILVVSFVFLSLSTVTASGQERSLAEFKEYVSGKAGDRASETQLTRIVKLVDKDGDGKVSQAEFDSRMDAFRKVMSGPTEKPVDKENSANESSKNRVTVEMDSLTDSTDAIVLLITGDEIAKEWLPFARWKTANGKLTKIITVEQIDRDFKADNIQEKIRLCVRDHIDNHKTRWVILGGDSLPGGKGLVPGGHRTVHAAEPQGIPTDIVYLSKTNWDADGDGVYGEFDDDRDAISYPDGTVGLGRIPVRTAKDVSAFTEKVIAYESNYPTNEFATNMVYTCTDQPAYPKVRNSWDGYLSDVWDGQMNRFFSAETPWDKAGEPGSYPLSAENVVDLFNKKTTGKLHIHGHGHLPAWVFEKSQFTDKHTKQLKNAGAYPLITTVSCNTGEYDSKNDPSIVERLLRLPNAGSVAVVAPVRTGKPHFAKRSDFKLMVTQGKLDGTTLTMTRYWVYGLGEGASTGHAIMKAKQAMAQDAIETASYHLCVCELNLLGDPTLDMRAQSPRVPEIEIATATVAKNVQISVSTDAPNSTISLWDSGNVYQVTTADKEGKAAFLVEAPIGKFTITVSGANLNSKSQSIEPANRTIGNNSVGRKYFHKPIRLKADGKSIETKWFGHAAPALVDLDGDGDLDLLVGQYTDGDVDVYKNIGSNVAPKYSADGKLKAAGEVAAVSTFCCVGFTPCVVDFDGDGVLDILSGSYPGELHIFRGNKDGTFDARADIKDKNDKPLKPGLATTAYATDLDGDGDLDLLSSLKKGGVSACYNNGTIATPLFGDWEDILVDDKPVPFAHAGPVVFDFDRDGIKDLIVASEKMVKNDTWQAKLIFYRNKSKTGKPVYELPQVILDGHIGLRLKVFPIDYDLDGQLDLLVGDMFADCPQDDYTGYVWLYRGKSKSESKETAGRESIKARPSSIEREAVVPDSNVRIETATTKQAGNSQVVVSISVSDHWHIYSNEADESSRTLIEFTSIPGVVFSKPEYPDGKEVLVFGETQKQYAGNVEIRIPFQLDDEQLDPDHASMKVMTSYTVCGDSTVGGVCMPRRTAISHVNFGDE